MAREDAANNHGSHMEKLQSAIRRDNAFPFLLCCLWKYKIKRLTNEILWYIWSILTTMIGMQKGNIFLRTTDGGNEHAFPFLLCCRLKRGHFPLDML